MSKKCPDCGSLNVEEVFDNESYCRDCSLHCATDDFKDATIFDHIKQSPEVMAKFLVFHNCIYKGRIKYHSAVVGGEFDNYAEAYAATVARLKEVSKLKEVYNENAMKRRD